ncbi:hypothetical protein ACFLTM_04370 [Candidatus Bipolaricaulota bacterium]
MNNVRNRLALILAMTILTIGVAANGQPEPAGASVRLLVVDETKTFLSTMRVGGLVGALKATGLFHVDIRFADVEAEWDDPLAGMTPEPDLEPYDVILVIPQGIDDASVDWLWLLSDGPANLPPPILGGVELIEQILNQVFEGNVRTLGVYDDLLIGCLYGLYVMEGWMR